MNRARLRAADARLRVADAAAKLAKAPRDRTRRFLMTTRRPNTRPQTFSEAVVEAAARVTAWFVIPTLVLLGGLHVGWRWAALLAVTHGVAIAAGVLGRERLVAMYREANDWLGEWVDSRKRIDLFRDRRDVNCEETVPVVLCTYCPEDATDTISHESDPAWQLPICARCKTERRRIA